MAHKNQKIEKKKEYNPFRTKVLKRFKINEISGYLRAVIPNHKALFGGDKVSGMFYDQNGYSVTPASYGAEMYDPDRVYYYEVVANDGSYRKCTTKEDAEVMFAQLTEFERRQMQIQ